MVNRDFDQVVANVYAAAAGRINWWEAMEPLAIGLDLWGLQVIGVDKRTGTQLFSHEGGLGPPQAPIDYVREYHQVNPRILPGLMLRPDEWLHDHKIFDEPFVEKSRFYQDFMIPYGGRYLSGTKIHEDAESLVLFAAMRGHGKEPLNEDEIDLLERLKLHLKEAIRIYLHLRGTYSEASAGKVLLDEFRYPMALVDELRGIHFCNSAARASLATTDFILQRGGTLCCRDRESDTRLLLAIKTLDLPNLARRASPPTRSYGRILNPVTGKPIVVYTIAIRPQGAMGAFGQMPLALLVFYDPGDQAPLDPFIVAETFDFTPAEANVAIKLSGGLSPEHIAEAGMVSISTVRSQIQSIFSKTGTHRQTEVVQMLASMNGLGFVRD